MKVFALGLLALTACSSLPVVPIDGAIDGAIDASADGSAIDAATDATAPDANDASVHDAPADAAVDAQVNDVSADGAQADAALAAASTSTLMINEIYVGSGVTGDSNRFIEIAGPAGTSLADLQIRVLAVQGNSTVVAHAVSLTSTNATMPSSGRWVVGGALVSNVNEFYSVGEFGLPSARGAVQLVRIKGVNATLIDVVGYGSPALAAPSVAPLETVEGAVASVPSGDTRSIGRASAVDTNQNASDFCSVTKSPGAANGACTP